jgi:hypothetical protein
MTHTIIPIVNLMKITLSGLGSCLELVA